MYPFGEALDDEPSLRGMLQLVGAKDPQLDPVVAVADPQCVVTTVRVPCESRWTRAFQILKVKIKTLVLYGSFDGNSSICKLLGALAALNH